MKVTKPLSPRILIRAFILDKYRKQKQVGSSPVKEIECFSTDFVMHLTKENMCGMKDYLPKEHIEYKSFKLPKHAIVRSRDTLFNSFVHPGISEHRVCRLKLYLKHYKKPDGQINKDMWTINWRGYWVFIIPFKFAKQLENLKRFAKWCWRTIFRWMGIKLSRIFDFFFAGIISSLATLCIVDNKDTILSWIYKIFG